jgi:ABC-type spermidine/putrescine transport system permease subunit II
MSIGLIAAVMAILLCTTVAVALWRCSHPYRMRYRRCAQQRQRAGICRHAAHH